MANLVKARVEAVRRLTRRRVSKSLERVLEKSSSEDIAAALSQLTLDEVRFLLERLGDGGELLVHLSDRDFERAVDLIPFDRLVSWLDALEADDKADVIARLPEGIREKVLGRLQEGDREQVEELLAWPGDSAGGIMSPIAFRMHEGTTCREAIESLQEHGSALEMVFYLYVENENDQLVGVTSLRNLLTHPPSTRLSELMTTGVISVLPETDQEEVARIASRYDFLAVPVVDDQNHMLGIVTIDDVIDVIREEAAEDMMLMAGVGESFDPHGISATAAARQRMKWLTVTFTAGLMLSEVITGFEDTMSKNAAVAGFIPVVMGMGGNVGIQAATITVRNLATGHVTLGEGVRTLLFRESRVGMLMGITFGAVISLWCGIRYYPDWTVGVAVGLSIFSALATSAVLGTLIPLVLERFHIDPAVATGPFVTTVIDLLAVVLYFLICTQMFAL